MFQENVQWKDQLKDIDLASKEFVRKKKKKKVTGKWLMIESSEI